MSRPGARALLLLGALAAGCAEQPAPEPTPVQEPTEEETEGLLTQTNQRPVLLFFPSQEGEGLVPEERIIFLTATLTSQVKQAVSELILGPAEEDGDAVPAFARQTRLLGVYMLGDGTAVIDLGSEVNTIPRGSSAELGAVYALVDTVIYNFPGVESVKVLVEGEEVATLGGHVDLSRPLRADMKRVEWGSLGPPSDKAGPRTPWDRWVAEEPDPEAPATEPEPI